MSENHINEPQISNYPSGWQNLKPQTSKFLSGWFLLNGAQRNVFSPERSGGLFIEFCQHEVPSLLPCRMEANLFAYSRHDSDDAGRSPRQNVFLFFLFIII